MPVEVDTSDLNRLQAQLKLAEANIQRDYRKGLRGVGQKIADSAKEKIEHKAPETAALIRVRTSGAGEVRVEGGDKDHPVAKLYEGAGGIKKPWRHPVFGNRKNWVKQMNEPHLYPAFIEHRDEALENLKEHVDTAMHEAGFRSEDGV